MRVRWDKAKAAQNVEKHRVSFDLAATVFDDPYSRTVFDRIVGGEERWHTLGAAIGGIVLLIVVHTWHDNEGEEIIRIISARRATPKERRDYERKED